MKYKLLAGAAMVALSVLPAHAGLVIVSVTDSTSGVAHATYNGVTTGSASTLATTSGTATSTVFNLADAFSVVAKVDNITATSTHTANVKGKPVTSTAEGTDITETANASLASLVAGNVAFSGSATAWTNSTFAAAKADATGNSDYFDYKFTGSGIAKEAKIEIDWSNVFATKSGSWDVLFDGNTTVVNVVGGHAAISGSVFYHLVNGANELKIYEVGNLDSVSVTGKLATASGSQTADFNWTITGVPEVSTWVMMLAGFVGLGFVGYSRNRKSGVEA